MSFALLICAVLLVGCSSFVRMVPMHDPIYPAPNAKVTFELEEAHAGGGIQEIKLYVRETPVTVASPGSPGPEKLIDTTKPPGQPLNLKNHTVNGPGFPANRLVRYRFEITDKKGVKRSHTVQFATRPYPMSTKPAPIYVQGDVNKVLNVVFIPDDGLKTVAQLSSFRTECRKMLKEMLDEPTLRFFNGQFNFFINPAPGNATAWSDPFVPHGKPSNASQISFAQAKAIVHDDKNLVNHGSNYGGYMSATISSAGSMRHEAGHALFNLADEYPWGGGYWEEKHFPNLWKKKTSAKNAAAQSFPTKTPKEIKESSSKSWWRLCDDCQMKTGYFVKNFDTPCVHRVIYMIVERAVPGALTP